MNKHLSTPQPAFNNSIFSPWWLQITLLLLFIVNLTFLASAQTVNFEPVIDTVADSKLEALWTKPMGGSAADRANSVVTDKDGNVYTVGSFSGTAAFGNQNLTSKGATDFFITKHNASGTLIWARQGGGTTADQASQVTTDASGNIFVTGTFTGTAVIGSTNLTSQGASDIFIAKYNTAGSVTWAKSAGGTSDNGARTLATDVSGNTYLAGSYTGTITIGSQNLSTDNQSDIFMAKFNASGNVVYAKKPGGTTGGTSNVIFDKVGNAYATGSFFNSTVIGNITLTDQTIYWGDYFIAKYDAAGNVQWAKESTTTNGEGASGVFIDFDASGNIIVKGIFRVRLDFDELTLTEEGWGSIFFVKYNVSGQMQWAESVAGGENVSLNGFDTDKNDNIYFGYGTQAGSSVSNRYYSIIKFNKDGNLEWVREFSAAILDVLADPAGHVYVVGGNNTEIYNTFGRLATTQTNVQIADITANSSGNLYLAGNFKATAKLNEDVSLTSKGSTDAFLTAVTYSDTYIQGIFVERSPFAINTADFNGDSKADIITTNGNVSVYLGKGNGQLADGINTPMGAGPQSINTTDFNRDGKVDIATLNSNTIVIGLGNGAGSFTISKTLNISSFTDHLITADFNNDGKPDLAAHDFNYVFLFFGDGTGSFTEPKKYQATATLDYNDRIRDMTVADFNSDGKPDIITSHAYLEYLSLLLNKGDGLFGIPKSIPAENGAYQVVATDVNGDKKPDIIAENHYSKIVSVFLNDGSGAFAAPKNSELNYDYFYIKIVVADFNSDGKPDLAIMNENSISVLTGDGTGTFAAPQDFPLGRTPSNITVGDFNNDGRPDLASANNSDQTISILLNTSSTTPTSSLTLAPLADTYVQNGSSAGTNYGNSSNLVVKSSPRSGYSRSAYLKFALGNASNISSAKLRIYGNNTENTANINLTAYSVSNDNWTETSINWNNAPVAGTDLSTVGVNNQAKYYELDVTDFVQAQAAGDKVVSFLLKDAANQDKTLRFNSKENTANPPQLILQTAPTTLTSVADAYVQNGSSAGTNYGNSPNLVVKSSPRSGYSRSAYLKFALGNASNISSATLRIYGNNTENTADINLAAYGVSNDVWAENSINWNNAPLASTTILSSVSVNNQARYYELDVTNFVQAQLKGDKTASFLIKNPTNQDKTLRFNSKENAANPPQLILEAGTVVNNSALRIDQNILSTVAAANKSKVYPNPVNKQFMIQLSEQQATDVSLQIVDELGRSHHINKQHMKQTDVATEVDISNLGLKGGVYFLKINSAKQMEVLRLIVQ